MSIDRLNDEEAETVELPAGTLLHYCGMPLELVSATTVRMNEANRRVADAFAAGGNLVRGSATASPGTASRSS